MASKTDKRSRGTIGIKQIAAQLDVSIGTVDRALHGRPGINAITRAKVLDAAAKLGYKPNLAARMLRSQKKLRVAVLLPAEIASFYESVRQGVRAGATPFQNSLQLEFASYPRLGEGEAAAFEAALDTSCEGFIIAPGRPSELKPWIRLAEEAGRPVICVSTDAEDTARSGAVVSDPHTGGAMAGELLCRFRGHFGKFAVFTGDLSTTDHWSKSQGFRQSVERFAPGPSTVSVLETHDNAQEARQRAEELLRETLEPAAIYVATANCLPVLDALRKAGKLGRIPVVTTDLFPEIVDYIQSGQVLATIHQRPEAQGRRAIHELYRYLVDRTEPPGVIRLTPHVVMQSNLEIFVAGARNLEANDESS